jgi:hypothetical protein
MKGSIMKCEEMHERMPEVTAGFDQFTADESKHVESCAACAEELKAMNATMALLDEWKTPEPSRYFDTRLQARLREEMAQPQAGWMQWFRRPALAAALTVIMGVGIGMFVSHNNGMEGRQPPVAEAERGTAVSDLQDLEQNHDLYSNFEVLDDLDVQPGAVANP